MKKENEGKYPAYIGFHCTKELKEEVQKYAEEEGVTPAVIFRKALVFFLKEKGHLDKNKRYL